MTANSKPLTHFAHSNFDPTIISLELPTKTTQTEAIPSSNLPYADYIEKFGNGSLRIVIIGSCCFRYLRTKSFLLGFVHEWISRLGFHRVGENRLNKHKHNTKTLGHQNVSNKIHSPFAFPRFCIRYSDMKVTSLIHR